MVRDRIAPESAQVAKIRGKIAAAHKEAPSADLLSVKEKVSRQFDNLMAYRVSVKRDGIGRNVQPATEKAATASVRERILSSWNPLI